MKFGIIIKELKTHQQKHGSGSSEKEQSFIIDLLFFTLEKNKETELSRQELLDFAKLLFKHQDLAETKNLSKTFTFFFSRLISNSVGDDYYYKQQAIHHSNYSEIDPVFRRNYLDSLRQLNENQRLDLHTFEAFNQYARKYISYWPVVSEHLTNIVEKPHLTQANLDAIFNTKQSFLLIISRLMASQFPINQQRFDQLYRMSEQDRRFILYILLNGPKLDSNEATMTLEEFGQLIDLVDEKHNPCPADELKYIYHLSANCDIYQLENLRLLLDASIQTKSQVYKLTELINTCLKSTNDKALFSRTVILMLHNITLWGHICDTLKKNGFYAYTNPHCDDPRSSWFKLERIAHELQDETCQDEEIKAQLKSKLDPLCSAQTYRVMCYQEVSDALSEYDDNRKHQGEQQIAGSYINLKQLADNIKPYTLITSLKEFCADRDLSKTMDERARYSLAHALLSDDHQGKADTLYAIKSKLQKKLITACTGIDIDEQSTSHIHFFDTLALMQTHGLLSEDSFFAYTAACQSVSCEAWVTMDLGMRTLETNHLFNDENLHQLCLMANPPSLRALYLFSSAQLAFGQEDFDHLMRLNDNKLAIFLQVLERFEMDIKAQQRGEDAKYQLSGDDLLRFLSYLSAEVADERCIKADDFDSAIIQLGDYTDMMQLERLKQVLDAPICTGNIIYRTTLLLDLLKAFDGQSEISDPIRVILSTTEHWSDYCDNESNLTEIYQLSDPSQAQSSTAQEKILQSQPYRLLRFMDQLPPQALQTITRERFSQLSNMRDEDRQFILYVLRYAATQRQSSYKQASHPKFSNSDLWSLIELTAENGFHCMGDEPEVFSTLNGFCDLLTLEKLSLLLNPAINSKKVIYKVINFLSVLARKVKDEDFVSSAVTSLLSDITLWGYICDALDEVGFYSFDNDRADSMQQCWLELKDIVTGIKQQGDSLLQGDEDTLKAVIRKQVAPLSTLSETEQSSPEVAVVSSSTVPCDVTIHYSPSARDLKMPFLSQQRANATATDEEEVPDLHQSM